MTTPTLSRRGMLQVGLGALGAVATATAAHAQTIVTDVDAGTLTRSKTTPLGLYLTPAAAHRALSENPEILFVDVRDPIEITYVGHPAGLSRIVPLRIATHDVDPGSGQYRHRDNPRVLRGFERLLADTGKTRADPLFVTCRSGSRSAAVARMLIGDGYTNVWNLTEGFEGDRAGDGTRRLNGWRNAGLPWGYRLNPGVAWQG